MKKHPKTPQCLVSRMPPNIGTLMPIPKDDKFNSIEVKQVIYDDFTQPEKEENQAIFDRVRKIL